MFDRHKWNGIAILVLFLTAPFSSNALIDTVWTYNNEFSVNMPGGAVEAPVISAGDTVRWIRIQGNHTTTSVAGSSEVWDSPLNSTTIEFDHVFDLPGVYVYYCIPHGTDNGDGTASGMFGTITVLSTGPGACCLFDGTCLINSPAECLALGGAYQGDGTSCSPNPCSSSAVTTTLPADKDNVLYESSTGALSNGEGRYLWSGAASVGSFRSVVHFDLSSIPSNAQITDVTLRLYCDQNNGNAVDVDVHRLLSDWGEGTSNANGDESGGDASTLDDATWIHTFYDSQFWSSTGGDYEPSVSATNSVNADGIFIEWNASGMINDVQSWMDDPSTNFGWIFMGDELDPANAKRFSSRNSNQSSEHPELVITYVPGTIGACCLPDGSCTELTAGQCSAQSGTFQGDNVICADVDCPIELTQFLDPLPLPGVAVPMSGTSGGAAHYAMAMTEQFQQLHSELPPTRVWGYNGGYPGPTIEAYRGDTVTVVWANDLRVFETDQLRTEHALTVDTCLHGPDHTGTTPVGIVHLHGGKVAPESDGDPDLAYPPGQQSPTYIYPNDQPAATLWYHDHALGITRLNVMMGMAGFYILRDANENVLALPSNVYEVPLVIQDRSFHQDGRLKYPTSWQQHFFGDKILVNGKVWPYLNVDQGKYRFRVINGSNSRTYTLALSDNATFWQIGTDQGLLAAPVALNTLTIVPGERADLVVDFSIYTVGTEIILTNSAPAPFPGIAGVGVVPEVMKFIVQGNIGYNAPLPSVLSSVPLLLESEAFIERDLELELVPNPCPDSNGPMWTINGLMWDDITEEPILGATEVWRWINNSGIGHPMHMHLVLGQILDRQEIDAQGATFGPVIPPLPNEIGWKDTWNTPPGFVTRVIARFDGFTGEYPYHCHILEHEDHEMMRQFNVLPPVRLSVRALLGGPYDDQTGLMFDSLRLQGLLPLTEPYSNSGFPIIGGAGTTTTFDVFLIDGSDAIVDWVVLELRDASQPEIVLRTRPALIQRDGDIVHTDGISPVSFDVPADQYYVAVRHRNHLGCMTAQAVALNDSPLFVDFTDPSTLTWGTEARKTVGSSTLLWSGNVVNDDLIKYTGSFNDRDPILVEIGGTVPTNVTTGYKSEDVNLDGSIKYTGSMNDRDPILVNIGGTAPTNTREEQIP